MDEEQIDREIELLQRIGQAIGMSLAAYAQAVRDGGGLLEAAQVIGPISENDQLDADLCLMLGEVAEVLRDRVRP